jgi:hypothetical protein
MFKNYFKIAWRNFIKNRVSSLINVSGLAVGMAVAMLIGLWIYDELSFNKYHQNYDRIAKIMSRGVDPKEGPYVNGKNTLSTGLQTNYRQFQAYYRASWARLYSYRRKKLWVKEHSWTKTR